MGTNIFANNNSPLDSHDHNDPYSVTYKGGLLDDALVLQAGGKKNTPPPKPKNAFYTPDGEFLGYDDKNEDKVYLSSKGNYDYSLAITGSPNQKVDYDNLRKYSIELAITNTRLIKIAGISYAEGSNPYGVDDSNEIYAIAFINYNYPSNTAFGEGTPQYKRLVNASPLKRNGTFFQICIYAVLNAVQKGTDFSNGSTHWDGIDILCGRGAYGWDPLKHPKQQAEGKYKGISDPSGLATTYYDNVKSYLEDMISKTKNDYVKKDLEAKYEHLQPLTIYQPEYDDKGKLKYIPLYEIRATYALTIFYKKLR